MRITALFIKKADAKAPACFISAEGRTRTGTPEKAPPPQDGVSTNSTTPAVKLYYYSIIYLLRQG